ncbi:hypothetical protein [Allokutzneria oryzae]|uniref:Uncharacterized protein n=1 Tax=Allokutzneria oryzae TaxID=1378989 RepID=A0ABV6A5R0_9PSEU
MTAPQPPENQNQGGQQAPGETNEDKGGAAAEQQTPSTAGELPTTTHGAGQEGSQGITSALGGSSDSGAGNAADATQVVSSSGQQQAASADATQVVAGGASAQQPTQQVQQGYGQQPQQPQWGAQQQPQQQWGQQPPQQGGGTPSGGFQQPAWGAQQQPGAQPQGQWGQQAPQQQWGQQQGWGQQAPSSGPPLLPIAMWASFAVGGLGLILGLTQLPSLFAAMDQVSKLGSFAGGRFGSLNLPSSGTLTFAMILAIVQIVLYPVLAFGAFWAGMKGKIQGRLIAGGAAAGIAVIGLVVFIMLSSFAGGAVFVGIILNAVLAVLWFLPQTAAAIGANGAGQAQAAAWGQQQGQWGQQQAPQQQWGQQPQQPQQQQWGQQAPQQPQQQWGQQQPGQQPGQQGWPGQQ